ncbi:MAG: extracellular matrix regulator RemB [Saccharofermentanales bacterium]|jgi:hypothetical protein|nr:DUF370 domain-containing protein [Bacillota bacterium]NLB08271.1 DUF370 domain-containing protein [Clostridiales bacterium]
MYIHIGADVSLPAEWIVGIFDLDHSTQGSADTVKYLARAEENHLIDILTSDLPRSLVVTINRAILSPVSSDTLRLRWERGLEQSRLRSHM